MNKCSIAKKRALTIGAALLLLFGFSACADIGEKTASLSVIYGVTMCMSLLLLIGYCSAVRDKDKWFLLLFVSVVVVNVGYFRLSVSMSLEQALFANGVAYLGSVFLPLSMLMILLRVIGIRCPKWLVGLLVALSVVMFVIAASPGYSDVYYKQVTLERVNGVSVLSKVYGPLHPLYLFYLLGYFGTMVVLVVGAVAKGCVESGLYSAVLVMTVFLNVGVWLLEQMVKIEFELLSVSYIISELFLLGLHLSTVENQRLKRAIAVYEDSVYSETALCAEKAPLDENRVPDLDIDAEQYLAGMKRLTATERAVFDLYISGKGTKEIMSELSIKENTLKFHNKNIYGKLGVSSRKQLISVYRTLQQKNMLK